MEIVYGPVTEPDGYRVTRIRREDGSMFTVRVPPGADIDLATSIIRAGQLVEHPWVTED